MSLADYNTSYVLTLLCMLVIDYLMIRRLSKGNYFGSHQKWVNIMLIVSGICAFSDIMCILMEGVRHKFPVFFFNALFNLVFALVAFFLFYYIVLFLYPLKFHFEILAVLLYHSLKDHAGKEGLDCAKHSESANDQGWDFSYSSGFKICYKNREKET